MKSDKLDQLTQDLHPPLAAHDAMVEADRCYFCHDAPCITACPTGIDIPLFIRQIKTGNLKGSARTIFDENIFGGMCARVCPTETLCEQACVRNTDADRPVSIGSLQRVATDHQMQTGEQPYKRATETHQRVAVVGAGPAGIACAHRLALYGHRVDVFDAMPKPGGLNEYGIASYKTVNDFASKEVNYILSIGGINIKSDQVLGVDFTLASLKADYNAVFLGLGMAAVNTLDIDGAELAGVDDAVGFIRTLRQATDLKQVPYGNRTVVIGGGMTAIDAAVQTRMLGADEVTVVYRGDGSRMKASIYEQNLAKTNDVVIRTGLQPLKIHGENGRVSAVEFSRTEAEASQPANGADSVVIECDQVLLAIGQTFAADAGIDSLTFANGRIAVDDSRRTSDSHVWAGGDCIDGGEDLTVVAVQDGKLAAESIHAFLRGQ